MKKALFTFFTICSCLIFSGCENMSHPISGTLYRYYNADLNMLITYEFHTSGKCECYVNSDINSEYKHLKWSVDDNNKIKIIQDNSSYWEKEARGDTFSVGYYEAKTKTVVITSGFTAGTYKYSKDL